MNNRSIFLPAAFILLLICHSAVLGQDSLETARQLTVEGNYAASNKILKAMMEARPGDPKILFYAGLNYQALSDFQKAAQCFESALQSDSSNINIMILLGSNYLSSGRLSNADSVLSAAYSANSTNRQVLLPLAKVFQQEQKWDDAKKIYKTLSRLDSANSYYHEQSARCDLAMNNIKEAIITLQIAHGLNPYNQATAIELSRLYLSQEQLISALRIIDDGLRIYPASPAMWTARGDVNLKMKDYGDAVTAYSTSMSLGDSSETNLRNLGIAYYWTGKFDSSIILLQQAVIKMDKDPSAFFYLGTSYKRIEQYDKAIENLMTAVKLQRNKFLAEALIQIGATYYEQKDYPNALKFYQDASRENPEKNEITFYLAAVYDHFYRDKTVAISFYRKFLSNAGKNTDSSLTNYAGGRISALIEENHFNK